MREAARLYALMTVVLMLKMTANSVVQGIHRTRDKAFVNPEDARFFASTTPVAVDTPEVERASRVWRNDLENIPMFLFLGLIYVLAGGPAGPAAIYFTVFTVARILHTITYLRGMQPWRTISFTIGGLATLALSIHVLILAFSTHHAV